MTQGNREMTEQEKEYRLRQGSLLSIMADEIRGLIPRYVGVYGIDYESATWGIYAALLTTIEKAAPQNQLVVMKGLLEVMDKRVRALSGEKPPAPAEEKASEDPPNSDP